MKDYRYWIQERRESTKQETNNYFAKYENKEVRVYSEGDYIYINWYIDGRLIEKPRFPKESIDEIYQFMESLHYKYICKNLMYAILHTVEKHLPYLEDGETPINWLKHVEIVGEIANV